ncbi:hypothetical protein [Magnetospira sp. QH-2]|uniref:hypothetical protein n=1 Tax=Magnetospira sp. (strain QH-2) TaxID=1288970 RepID=UPI0003E81696|nr:hypothetical protein [Magnetospira sp. QH-2]CCQ72068.1 conserved protein of unknown function [Magnetospira sp. QH-2]
MAKQAIKKKPWSVILNEQKSRKYESEREVVSQLVDALRIRVEELDRDCNDLRAKGADVFFANFLEFQNHASESLTFLIIIERKLKSLIRQDREELKRSFDDLSFAVWSIVLKGSLFYIGTIAEEVSLPVGSREIFIRELRTLHEAHQQMSRKRYRERNTEQTKTEIKKAEKILEVIIEKAPSLLAF